MVKYDIESLLLIDDRWKS